MNCYYKGLTIGILCLPFFMCSAEETFIVDAVGKILKKNDEVANCDRDANIPTLFDKNRADLMRKRDRKVRAEGQCYPPPDVIVSPYLFVPCPK